MNLIPMNDYIIVEIDPEDAAEAPGGRFKLINPEDDVADIQTGHVIHPGKYDGHNGVVSESERLEKGQTVHWYRFADSGQRITTSEGKIIAHIRHERLMSKEGK